LYDVAIKAGALGGKLLGAGGGGFLLFYCEKEKQASLKNALERLMIVPFNFENDGAQVLYYAPQTYSPRKAVLLK
jgi:D-glycero-alpha-D-manno-heptose-7-phosphate kinase